MRRLSGHRRVTCTILTSVPAFDATPTMLLTAMPAKITLLSRLNGKWIRVFAALTDQVWLSLLNFAISLAFIRMASKAEYALFILLQTPIFLVQGVQNALFISPQATVLPASAEDRKPRVKNTSAAGQAIVASLAALLCAIGLVVYRHVSAFPEDWLLAASFAVAILGAMAREGVRAARYVDGRTVEALLGDLVYGFLLLLTLALIAWEQAFTAQAVLFAMGLSGLVPLLRVAWKRQLPSIDRATWKEFWACGRWALPGVLVTWINLNAYPYVAAVALGAAAVADINAARLFLMPVALSITAWSNLVRPKISALMARNQPAAVRSLSLQSLMLAEAGLVVFILFIVLTYPLLEQMLGAKYYGLLPLVLAWAGFFALSLMRNIFMATLMSAPAGYRRLHHLSWVALALVLPALVLLSPRGAAWVIGVLGGVELLTCVIVARAAFAFWNKAM